jgi:hypothetical protein
LVQHGSEQVEQSLQPLHVLDHPDDLFAEDEIPELSLSRNVPSQIARMFEHYRDTDLPADFD